MNKEISIHSCHSGFFHPCHVGVKEFQWSLISCLNTNWSSFNLTGRIEIIHIFFLTQILWWKLKMIQSWYFSSFWKKKCFHCSFILDDQIAQWFLNEYNIMSHVCSLVYDIYHDIFYARDSNIDWKKFVVSRFFSHLYVYSRYKSRNLDIAFHKYQRANQLKSNSFHD